MNTWKRFLSLLLALVFCVSLFPPVALAEGEPEEPDAIFSAQEQEEEDSSPSEDGVQEVVLHGTLGSDLIWMLDDEMKLTISGSGAMPDFGYYGDAPWRNYRTQILSIEMHEGITKIGDQAFLGCSSITSVTIPESVIGIGDDAFNNCNALHEITFIGHAPTFGNNCFFNVTASVFYPNDGSWTDSVCQHYGGTITWVLQTPNQCGENLIWTINDGVLQITGSGAMWDWDKTPSVPWYSYQEAITEIIMPEGLTSIGKYAFSGCCELNSVTVPANVISIGYEAFSGCISLTSVTIPSSVTVIESKAFQHCDQIQSVYIDDFAWWLSLSVDDQFTLPHGDLYIDGILLEHAELPEGLLALRPGEFRNCKSLQSASLPESLCSIAADAFIDCERLTSITIPTGVTNIFANAFANCRGLKNVFFLGNAPTIESDAFNDDSITVLYPVDNETWTDDLLVDYGANSLFWVGYRGEPKCYTVHYDANGGPEAPDDQIKGKGVDICLSVDVPAREGFIFLGWAREAEAVESEFEPGSNYSENADLTLYAVWMKNEIASGQCGDNCFWVLDLDGVLTISGTGDMWDWGAYSGAPWYNLRESITGLVLSEGLTRIGKFAFNECDRITSVSIPQSVTVIDEYAFGHCKSIISIEIPKSVTAIGQCAFILCESLSSVAIPENVTSIGTYAFCNCKNLSEVIFEGNAPSFGSSIFYGVTAIAYYPWDDSSWTESIMHNYGGSITWLPMGSPCGDELYWIIDGSGVLIISGTGEMWDWSTESRPPWYNYRTRVTELFLSEGVTSIGKYAFSDCSGMQSVTIPSSLQKSGYNAFSGCSSLSAVDITNLAGWCGTTFVDASANPLNFAHNLYINGDLLTTLEIPSSVTSIGTYSFYGCWCLSSVAIPDSVMNVGRDAFANCRNLKSAGPIGSGCDIEFGWQEAIPDNAFSNCSSLTTVKIPSSVITIGHTAFLNCDSLHSLQAVYIDDLTWWLNLADSTASDLPHGDLYINGMLLENAVIPEGITVLNTAVFRYCKSLKSISLPESLVRIDSRAFEGCSSLPSITIPASVNSIGDAAFLNCVNLVSINIPNSVTTIPTSAFWDCTSLEEITIPESVNVIGNYAFRGCSGLKTISFLGNVPRIASSAFSSTGSDSTAHVVCAMALYPIDNDTWSADKLVNYGADSLTWVGYREEAKAYSVHYDPNGGFGGPSDEIKGHGVDLTLSNLTPLRFNESVALTVTLDPVGGNIDNSTLTAKSTSTFSFNNWNTASDGAGDAFSSGTVFSLNSDTTLFAQWNASISTTSVTLPTPSREGYDFMGWADSPDASSGITGKYTPEENVTLFAIWKAHSYAVNYDANGGDGAPESQTKTAGIDLALSDQQPTKSATSAGSFTVTLDAQGGECEMESLVAERTTSFSFCAWNTAVDGSGDSYAPGDVYTANEAVTLYAQWDSSTATASVTLPTPTREGYTFQGWATGTTAVSGVTGEYTPPESQTLYAIWTKDAPLTGPKFVLDGATVVAGQEIRIPVRIENNPGVVSIEISVAYDETVLEWIGVEEGEYGGGFDTAVGVPLTWYAGDPRENETKDGVFAILTFRIKDDAPVGTTQVTVRYDENYIYNADEENQLFAVEPAELRIITYIPGDINGDGELNNKDVTRLIRYIKYHDVEANEAALDVNGDGQLNNKDVTRLQRYIKYHDVEIH